MKVEKEERGKEFVNVLKNREAMVRYMAEVRGLRERYKATKIRNILSNIT